MAVVSVIVILMAIIYPSVNSAIAAAYASQVRNRINDLGVGCVNYHNDNNYYPGQSASNALELKNAGANGVTGSQLLAEALFIDFTDKAWDGVAGLTNLTTLSPAANRSRWHWKGLYASLTFGTYHNQAATIPQSDLMTSCPTDPAVSGNPYCVSDRFGNGFLPILYFPAHLVDANGNPLTGLSQFVEADNIVYYNFTGSQVFSLTTNPAPNNYGWASPNTILSGVTTDFGHFIWNPQYGGTNTPYRAGEYLLIAAGRDRVYGSPYTIKNWGD